MNLPQPAMGLLAPSGLNGCGGVLGEGKAHLN